MMYPGKTDLLTYGYGVMNINGYYGHGGQTFGFQTFVTHNPKKNKTYVIAANDAAEIPAMAVFFMFEGIKF